MWLKLKAREVLEGEKTSREYSVKSAVTNGGDRWGLAGAIKYELSPARRLSLLPDTLEYSLQLTGPASSGWTAVNDGIVTKSSIAWRQARTTSETGLTTALNSSFQIPSSVCVFSSSVRFALPVNIIVLYMYIYTIRIFKYFANVLVFGSFH